MIQMKTCQHMLERVISHEASHIRRVAPHLATVGGMTELVETELVYSPGDRMTLVCPHGCKDIVIRVVPDSPDGSYD